MFTYIIKKEEQDKRLLLSETPVDVLETGNKAPVTSNAVKTKFDTVDGVLAANTNSITEIANTVSGHTTSITNLTNTVNGYTTTITGHTNSINSLTSTVNSHTSSINTINGKLPTSLSVDFTLNSQNGNGTQHYTTYGNVCTLFISLTEIGNIPNTNSYEVLTLGMIPIAAAIPKYQWRNPILFQAGTSPFLCEIGSGGTIRVWQWGSSARMGTSVTFTATFINSL